VKQRLLGRTRLPVGEIGFGGWAIGGNHVGNSYGATDDAESRRAVRRAFELGCTFFDTADVYGHGKSEELLGATLQDVRDRVILATKVGGNFYNRDVHPLLAERIAQMVDKPFDQIPPDAPLPATHDSDFTPRYVRFAVEQSLKRLGTDYIDLLQLHNPPLSLISSMDTYAVLEDLKREGKIRWYGVSVHPPEEGLAAVSATMPDTVQIVYNLARREAARGRDRRHRARAARQRLSRRPVRVGQHVGERRHPRAHAAPLRQADGRAGAARAPARREGSDESRAAGAALRAGAGGGVGRDRRHEDRAAGGREPRLGGVMPNKTAVFETARGTIEAELFADETPNTVANFEKLANAAFYDGTTFHRVIANFMIQGGDPYSKTGKGRVGTGGPGYTIKCETHRNVHKHVAGTLSMAHAGKDTGGSQFFICHTPQAHLDGVHTVFGQVTKGMDVVSAIKQNDQVTSIRVR